jgi:hypothetical protein
MIVMICTSLAMIRYMSFLGNKDQLWWAADDFPNFTSAVRIKTDIWI